MSRPATWTAGRRVTLTESNWLWGLALAVAGALLFTVIGEVEEAALGAPRHARLVWSPWETWARFLAIAHTIVATLFLLSSRRVRTGAGMAWLAGLAVLGVGLCLGFEALGGLGAAAGVVAFFAYFILHEVRDELFFYRANGDAPRPGPRGERMALWPLAGLLLTVFTVGLAGAILVGARVRRMSLLGSLTPWRLVIGLGGVLVGVTLAVALIRRLHAGHIGGWLGVLIEHRPLAVVLGGLYLTVMGGLAMTGRAYIIVTLHVMVWFVFALRQTTRRAGPRPRPLTWRWMRETPIGFTTFHTGVLAAVVAAAGVWAFGFDNSSEGAVLGVLLSRESFPYWTIMHVTLSWIPRATPS